MIYTKFISSFILAITAILFSYTAHATTDDAEKFVMNVADSALAVIVSNASDGEKRKKLENLFRDSVDVDWIGRFVLGKHWRTATQDQRKEYLTAYKNFIIKNYASRFGEYSGQSYKIEKSSLQADGDTLVTLKLSATGQPSVLTDFRVRNNSGTRKVVDIIVEGVSLITTQRSEFSSVVNRKSLGFLIDALEKRAK